MADAAGGGHDDVGLDLRQLRRHELGFGESYWRQAVNIDFLVDEGVVEEEDRALFWYAETAEEIWSGILRWHEVNGTPLTATTSS